MAMQDGAGQEGPTNDPCILLFTCLGVFVGRMQTISLNYAVCTHKLALRRAPPVYQAPDTGHGVSLLEGALAPSFVITVN